METAHQGRPLPFAVSLAAPGRGVNWLGDAVMTPGSGRLREHFSRSRTLRARKLSSFGQHHPR